MKIIKSKFLYGIIPLILTLSYAQYPGAGQTNYQNLLLPFNARSAAMAGASVSLPSCGISGVLDNPAFLNEVKKQQVFIGYQMILDDVAAAPLGYAIRYKNWGIFSTGIQIFSNRGVKVIEVGPDGEPIITDRMAFDEYLAPYLSYGRAFSSKILAGITLKGLYHRIYTGYDVYKSKAIAFDAGVQYLIVPKRIIVGAVIRNAGFEISSFNDETKYNLPLTFEMGISYVPRYISSARIILDVNKTVGDYINFEPAIELEIYENILYGRVGYFLSQNDMKEFFSIITSKSDDDYVKSNWTTLTAGLGLNLPIKSFFLTLDLAIQFRAYSVPPSLIVSTMFDF